MYIRFGYKRISIFLSLYFWLIFATSLFFTLCSNKNLNNFAFFFQGIFGFFTLFGAYQYYFYSYNKLLKEKHPNVFEKHKLRYTIPKGKVVSSIDFFTKPDVFKTLGPKELNEKYLLTVKALKLSSYSFLLNIPLTLI